MDPVSGIKPMQLVKNLFLSCAVTVVLLFALAFILYRMKLGVSQVSWGITLIYVLACMLGGFLTGRQVKTRRLLWGLLSGFLYFAVLLILSLAAGGSVSMQTGGILRVLAACLGGGALGAFVS